MPTIHEAASTDFTAHLDRWSVAAQSSPIMVTDSVSGVAIGYFLSPNDYEDFCRTRDLSPKSRLAWEMPAELADLLKAPITSSRRELDDLMGN
jgi:hypothetical protein